ncbi:serine/threonine-protein kinase [Saccharopolyspora sp. NPDC047091]|uniref:serine/threonine-protein kinase n=1 Tax=Saccharopolyspora sp. NPDC047091 TaxID=3155924 RepID=UPI0033E2A0B4
MEWQFGPYVVQGLIARGGMGEIHRALDSRHQRTVALKLIAERHAEDAEFRRRFQREAQATARLRDPHVIPIHSYGEIDGRLYLDMRLVDGTDLATHLASYGPLDPDRAVGLLEQVAHALDAAHADGLVHRDVKPSNVLVGSTGFAYLVDFGIAYAASTGTAATSTGITVGTLAYMAPERFGEGPAEPSSDVYSLTCLFYECLTGRKPFQREATVAMISAHLHDDPPRPGTTAPHLGSAFDAVIARGMAKDPAHRFDSAGDLAREAVEALYATPTEPRTTTVRQSEERPDRKSRGRFVRAALATLGVLAVAGAATAWALSPGDDGQATSSRPVVSVPGATMAADLGVSVPMSTPVCNDSYAVVVGAAFEANTVQRLLDEFPGTGYLHVPSTPCGASAKTSPSGKAIYSVYFGPFADAASACDQLAAAREKADDAYVKKLSATGLPAVIACD